MYIIKPDWNKFRAKFSENPQSTFEWFCYILFCQEFDRPFGIFRYKNQSGIETNPITKDEKVIGWQAKFYETTLSANKDELIQTLIKSKRDYTELTKIIFYTNQEWGQGKDQNDPQAKLEVEKKAEGLSIEIEWRTASFFESYFVTIKKKSIAHYFFSLDKSIVELLDDKQKRTESILFNIQTEIDFNNQKIKIDRNICLQTVRKELDKRQIIILSGVGGVGKTAVIKDLYEELNSKIPFYLFKANEFNTNNIKELFNNFDLKEFIEAHRDENIKIVVIDSAEKLLELQNTEPFKEFLLNMIQSSWKVIFTTRNNYLEDLNYEFIELHKVIPLNIPIQNLSQNELENLSYKYNFNIPKDLKFLDLIKNPFYLNEYLKFYGVDEDIDYLGFKQKLWNRIIKKSKPVREQCFLKIAFQRAEQNQFFVIPNFDSHILNELVLDGILGYETVGYFITHDIYEEWALEKIIETEYIRKAKNQEMLKNIGISLSIRRSFRNWVSEKLLLEDMDIKQFIENIIREEIIELFWKDEILVSILLSNYSETFFELFEKKLLENNLDLLKRLTFLLRIACKEVDSDFFDNLGIKNINLLSIKYIFTKPKGNGWQNLIKFVYKNLDSIGIENFYFILPIIHDWNNKSKKGETTKISSLIALKYYQWVIKEDVYFSRNEGVKERLLQTILYGSSEIKMELSNIFDEILLNDWKWPRDPYYDLLEVILKKLGDNIELINALPEYVTKLANLYWLRFPENEPFYYDSSIGIEKYFGLKDNHYFPASSFQTPIYWLLQASLQKTIEFILDFTNKTVECFAKSDLGKSEIEEIDVYIEDGNTIKQYICNRIWEIYRGTQVAPDVIQSMHMALEKFFLERGNNADSKVLESWLLFMLKNSISASISALVTSIVLAFPEKTFNVAKMLFKTKEFFLYDTSRLLSDQTAKSLYSIGYGLNYENKLYQDERIKTCDDKHRESSLEHLAFKYQFFRSEGITEEEAENRLQIIWDIFDKYYEELQQKSQENEKDKTWRLYLARMDRRKMKPTTEEKDGQILINFNPEIAPELEEFSEQSIRTSTEYMKYSSLKLWANYKMENDERYKSYEQYENGPKFVIKEAKEIIEELENAENKEFNFFNYTIPGHACSVLVRDYFGDLSEEEKTFCKDIVLAVASSSITGPYAYQISDGVESSISVLPMLFKEFPDEKERIKLILLLTLFDPHSIGMYCEFADYSKKAIINNLWEISFDDAQSLLFGYLWLKPKYDDARLALRKQKNKNNVYDLHENEVIEIFLTQSTRDLEKVNNNNINLEEIGNIDKMDLDDLKTAFQLIPMKSDNDEHKKLAELIINIFAKQLLSKKREDKVDYKVRHGFFEKLAYIVLNSAKEDILIYLKPFIDGFNRSESIAELLKIFISSEDKLATYDNFWHVWSQFYSKVVELCKDGEEYWYTKDIIKAYLFEKTFWREEATEWRTFKESNKIFFKDISENIGHCPSVLHSISKLLNGIGSIYLGDGVLWISRMLVNNKNLWSCEFEENTIYYLENVVKKYIFLNRERIRKTKQLKQEILVILDFLIEKTSVIGYMLRENIL
ncbi:MAG: ATPase family protein associated with various cellular activities (AAA) [Peptococcaceae bacterium BRH_c23]|nr:MAG: ATPase family protein associated with various cellular activities (AAA) [Peptococcaceae bacterium BRH_c23]